MRVAVIGAGIAGLGAALSAVGGGHNVVVYERNQRPGGHSATVDIDWDGTPLSIDTGFIVFNELNYPAFTRMLSWLGVASQPSDMSFAVSLDGGALEWCGRDYRTLSGLFAQRRNVLSLSYVSMLREILRFQSVATQALRDDTIGDDTLGEFLGRHRFSATLRENYVIPMGAAIWSMSPRGMLGFPARAFITFFDNHRLLQWDRPQWRTVTGGSRSYVERIAHILGDRLRTSASVATVRRLEGGVEIVDTQGHRDRFDHAILATHAPQSLDMLVDASATERAFLSAHRTADNEVWLHRDPRLMPRRRRAWAAWNALRHQGDFDSPVGVTYWMNLLQTIDHRKPVFVSLNPGIEPAAGTVFGRYRYAHPQFDAAAIAAQKDLSSIQGRNNLGFCGAWTTYGFHEDGLASGLAAAAVVGGSAPWMQTALREAAQ
jgi:predicted NAD/FAD-binding protein